MYNKTSTDAVSAIWTERCLASKVRRVHRVVVGRYDEALRPLGLTVSQLDMLMTLLGAGPDVRPIDLSRLLLMDRSTVSRNLDRLETRGLVVRTPGDSARESHVTVTPAGRRAAEGAAEAWFAAQEGTRARLGEEGSPRSTH